MQFIAEEVREYLARLGFRTLEEAIGRADRLETGEAIERYKASGLDLAPILHHVEVPAGTQRHRTTSQDHELDRSLDVQLIDLAAPALERGEAVSGTLGISNTDRSAWAPCWGTRSRWRPRVRDCPTTPSSSS